MTNEAQPDLPARILALLARCPCPTEEGECAIANECALLPLAPAALQSVAELYEALLRASKELHDAGGMLSSLGREFQGERFRNSSAEAARALRTTEERFAAAIERSSVL